MPATNPNIPTIMKHYRIIQVTTDINSVEDVEQFFNDLHREQLMIHPDDNFADSSSLSAVLPVATIRMLDVTLDKCRIVCNDAGENIGRIAWNVVMQND